MSYLINAGILPLTFANPDDYDTVAQEHILELSDIPGGMAKGELTVTNKSTGAVFTARCDLTLRQQAILLAGGLLNYTKEGGL